MSVPVRIDAHHHIWDLSVRDQPWTAQMPALRRTFSVEDLRPSLRRHTIDTTIVVQTVCVAEETPELLALAATEPIIGGVVGWIELTSADVTDTLARLREGAGGELLVGIRHQVQDEPDPDFLARPDVRRGLRAVADAGLVYELLVRPHQLQAAIDVARSLPDLHFVLDHAGKPDVAYSPSWDWIDTIERLALLPNVTVKLSGLTSQAPPNWKPGTLRPFTEVLISRFGPQRIMFGSDWPVCLLGGDYDATINAAEALTQDLARDEVDLIFGEVAAAVYGLSG
jgi:L-fuconolactonase